MGRGPRVAAGEFASEVDGKVGLGEVEREAAGAIDSYPQEAMSVEESGELLGGDVTT